MKRWSVGLIAVLLVGCTAPESEPPSAAPSNPPTSSAPASLESTPKPAPEPTWIFATNPRSAPLDLTLSAARRLLDGGQTYRGLRVVRSRTGLELAAHDPNVLAIAPTERLTPAVQVASVGGVDPLRDPAHYPLAGAQAPPEVTTMTVVGDIMLARRVASAMPGDPGGQLRAIGPRLASADLTVGNLESTLSQAGPPTQGGDSFGADPAIRGPLREAGFDVIDLANNHLGDFGVQALLDTVRLLRNPEAGFKTVGAGADLAAAAKPVVVTRDGIRFGFVAFNAIGETPAATASSPGVVSLSMPPRTGPLDRAALDGFLAGVRSLDRRVDVVVVLPHWGDQYTERPWPVQEQVARELVGAGADLVIGGHPHWVQGATMIGDALVVQSLGNFVFDMSWEPQTMSGVFVEAVFWDGRLVGSRFVPYRMDATFTPRVVSMAAGADIFELFWRFSRLGATR